MALSLPVAAQEHFVNVDAGPTARIVRVLYTICNSPGTGAALSRHLLRTLFARMRDAALPFLLGVWTAASIETEALSSSSMSTRLAALRHANAFVLAFVPSPSGQLQGDPVPAKDFQTVVPALLVALRGEDMPIRMAALACLRSIAAVLKASQDLGASPDVFAYDAIYGSSSESLQYLDSKDVLKYLDIILSHAGAFRNDAEYLSVLHHSLLGVGKQDNKKEATFKHSVVCYLLSHVVCWPNLTARSALLDSLRGLPDPAKMPALLPLIRGLLQSSQQANGSRNEAAAVLALPAEEREAYVALLTSAFDRNARSHLEVVTQGSWEVLLEALAGGHNPLAQLVQKHTALALNGGLFTSLKPHLRQEIYKHLAAIVADPVRQSTAELRSCLRTLSVDAAVLVSVFAELRGTITDKTLNSPEPKRARVAATTADEATRRASATLIALLESTMNRTMDISGALVGELFEVLRVAVELHSSLLVNAEYLMQLSMSCLETMLGNVSSEAADIVQAIRADIIVNAVKTSTNPQTFQQALLLLARVSSLAPEPVLHNVMPIFTFVGSTVLQRDDAYSFTVVERTTKSIVPGLVASLKERISVPSSHLHLLREARSFVRIFTDAATHVPRHRRQVFFKLLVEVLGPDEFLSAICMLLVDRAAYKVTKQPSEEVVATLHLPLAIMQAHSAVLQLKAMNQIWDEIARLWSHRDDDVTGVGEHVFLDRAGRYDREHSDKQAEPTRQILALLAFIQHTVSARSFEAHTAAEHQHGTESKNISAELESFVQHALRIGTVDLVDDAAVRAAANRTLAVVLGLVPIGSFMNVVTNLLGSNPNVSLSPRHKTHLTPCANAPSSHFLQMVRSGLECFAARINKLNEHERAAAAGKTPLVISTAVSVLHDEHASVPKEVALEALKAISSSAVSAEFGALAGILPVLVTEGQSGASPRSIRLAVLSITRQLTHRLGPRLIPHLAKLVSFSLEIVESSLEEPSCLNSSLRIGAFDTLSGLITTVPTFVSSYVAAILTTITSSKVQTAIGDATNTSDGNALNSMLASIVRCIEVQKVFDSTFRVWSEADKSSKTTLNCLLDFVHRTLRHADRAAIGATYKSVFRFMLKAFDMRREQPHTLSAEDLHDFEDHCLRAFVRMVLKLNETTFRPLFLRIYDWAVLDLIEDDTPINDPGLCARRMVLYKVMNALSDQLKGLVSGYYATMLDHTIELLQAYNKGKLRDVDLWTVIVASLHKNARNDEGTFWNPARLAKLAPALIAQVSLPTTIPPAHLSEHVAPALVALAQLVQDESTLKLLNSTVFAKTRAEDRRVRVVALQVLNKLWAELGDAMLGLVPESVPFVAELLDDDDEEVAEETKVLVSRIEIALGESLDSYLQ